MHRVQGCIGRAQFLSHDFSCYFMAIFSLRYEVVSLLQAEWLMLFSVLQHCFHATLEKNTWACERFSSGLLSLLTGKYEGETGGTRRVSPEETKVWNLRKCSVCVWLREECVDRQSVPPCQTHWGEPGDVGGVRGAGQRLSCSVNTSYDEGIHRVKRHISSSDFLPRGDKFRLQSHSFYSLHINQRGFSFFPWI